MRKSGILMPLTALPSPYGIGTLGKAAFDFVEFLAQAGQSLWQMLPIGPTGFGDSPYQSFSAFAGNPYNIDLDILKANGLLTEDEIGTDWGKNPAKADYGLIYKNRFTVLAKAAARQEKSTTEYRAFCEENAFWLDDYALFMAIKEAHGQRSYMEWPDTLRLRVPSALQAARAQYAPRVEFWRCLQFFYFSQLAALKRYASARGVALVGDIPIYVSDDSSDLWANPELFLLDEDLRPELVAGVPPDGFSADGQLWGNPLYDWRVHKKTKYAWWQARLKHLANVFDVIRIDHFRGFAGFFAIKSGAENAREGVWMKGPGVDFIKAIHKALPGVEIIAEDLGFLTSEVRELLEHSGYPGMKVLQFAFDSREESDYLPHNYPRHTVVYTGTHDNTTCNAWAKEANPEDVQFARRYTGIAKTHDMAGGMIRAAMSSVANTAIVPMQDWLGLGAAARFNTPSTLGGGNWRWRLVPGQLTEDLASHIRVYTRTWGRLSITEKEKERLARDFADNKAEEEIFGEVLPGEAEKATEKVVSMHPTEEEIQAAASHPGDAPPPAKDSEPDEK